MKRLKDIYNKYVFLFVYFVICISVNGQDPVMSISGYKLTPLIIKIDTGRGSLEDINITSLNVSIVDMIIPDCSLWDKLDKNIAKSIGKEQEVTDQRLTALLWFYSPFVAAQSTTSKRISYNRNLKGKLIIKAEDKIVFSKPFNELFGDYNERKKDLNPIEISIKIDDFEKLE